MSSSAADPSNSSRYVDFDEYVDLKLQKTRSTIKSTDLLVALAGVAAMFLGYLLVFVVLDQWVIPGGFGIGVRWLLLSTLLLLTGAWLAWKVGLPYFHTVNRLFAAREIEKADPDLKSSLLNLVDLRESGREVNATILRTLEKRAAVGLQKIDVAQAIDHRPLMRTAYALLAVVLLFSLYALFSPKKILNSVWRGLLPASSVGVATRTEILNVLPGDVMVLANEHPEVSADISGEVPDKVWLYFSTIDGAYQNEKVELRADGPGQTRFKAILHGENGKGLLQDLTYVVRAGDAESREYRIRVKQPPQASGHRVRIEFPPYMKLEPVEQVGGQIDSWEGAKVTVSARTNMPVKFATIELLDDAASRKPTGEEIPVTVSTDGLQLNSSWTLGFRTDGTYAKGYQIQVKTDAGEKDPSPIASSLSIRPDLPPEVAILDPVRDLEAPANSVLPMLVEARDPDFELSHVSLHIKKNGQEVDRILLSEGRQQRVMIKHDQKLDERMALKPGDLVELWVEAFDNRQPRPNRKSSPELKVKIVEPVSQKEVEQKLAQDKANRDERLQDAEREQNPDRRPDQPMQDSANENPRDKQEQAGQGNPMPKRQQEQNAQQQGDDQGQPGEGGQSKSKGKNRDQGKQQGSSTDGAGQQQSGKQNGKQNGQQQKPLSSDGDDDKEALEELIKKLGDKPKDSDKQAGKDGRSQGEQEKGSPSGDQKQKNDSQGKSSEENKPSDTEKSSESKPNGDKPSPREQGTQKPSRGNEQGKKGTDEPMPMPNQDGSNDPEKQDQSTKPGEESSKPGEQAAKPGEKSANDKQNPKSDGGVSKPSPAAGRDGDSQAGKDDGSKPNEGAKKNPSRNEGANGEGSKPERKPEAKKDGEKGSGEQPAGENPEQQPNQRPSGAGDKAGDKQPAGGGEKETNEQGNGAKSEPKSPMNKDGEGNPSDNPMPDGQREQAADSPDAKREKATGNETGKAKPDNDPNAKPTPSKNPGLERDPKEKPATRPGESESNDPTKTREGESTEARPKPGQKKGEKTDQQANDDEKSAEGTRKEKRDGEPKAANEPLQSKGVKDQRSESPSGGGEEGSSKQDSQGSKGSKDSGKGDQVQRPGEEQQADKQAGQPGGKTKPGAGQKTEDGNGEKQDGGQPGDKPGSKPMPKEGDKGDGDSAGKKDDPSGQKEKAAGPSDKNQKQSPEKNGSKTDKSQDGKQSGDKQQGGGQQSGDKTPGKQNGEGGKQPAEQGSKEGGQSGESGGQGPGKPGGKSSSGNGGQMKPGGNAGGRAGEGALGNDQADASQDTEMVNEPTADDGEEANLGYKKQATELVLKRLQNQLDRGEVDAELKEKLGWTDEETRRFADRLSKYLQEAKSAEATPESQARRQQFEEMLKSLNLKDRKAPRSGEKSPQREVDQVQSRQKTVPSEYRNAFDRISKELNRQKSTKPAGSSKSE